MDNNKIDEGLQGNEKIETAIAALQQEPGEEMLAHTLTVIRRRMKEGGQFIIAVENRQKAMIRCRCRQYRHQTAIAGGRHFPVSRKN